MNQIPQEIGVDVSKDELVAATYGLESVVHLANRRAAIRRWLKQLPAGCRIGVEATSTYHLPLAELAHAAGHCVYVLNPRQVARYLGSLRQRGKTDLLDAQGIARFVRNETDQVHPFTPPSRAQRGIASLIRRRHLLVKQRAALRQSSRSEPWLQKAIQPLLTGYRCLLAELDEELETLLAQTPDLALQRQRLQSIAGIGPLVSLALSNRLSQTDYRRSDALVAAFGLDPRPRESGTYQGRRKLSKQGHPEDRRLIYLAAQGACRAGLWQTERTQWEARGLSKTAVNCIIARKLLRIAFAVWRSEKLFDPTLIGKQACART
ncbi:Transposase [compost metagenome]